MSKYRFKTEKEFKRDGLWNKDRPFKWVKAMNKYLGKDIPDKYNQACDKQEGFRYEPWHIEPHDYVLKETAFVLPSKWCIKVTEENVVTLGNWRSSGPLKDKRYIEEGWYLHTPKHSAKGYNEPTKDPNYTEITFEQFKQHVLKESPVVETIVETLNQEEDYTGRTIKALVKSPQGTGVQLGEEIKILIKENKDTYILDITARGAINMRINRPLDLSDWELLPESSKEIDMKDIQEEAKKRFPIGCKFIPVDGDNTYTLIEDDCTYTINCYSIWAHSIHGSLYANGKWATLVSLPETTKEMFYERLVEGEIYIYDGSQISTYPEGPSISIHGYNYTSNPKWTWCLPITHATEEQKALLRGEIEKRTKKAKPMSQLWMSDPIVEERINTPSIKKETFIDNVQSVDIMLRTKKKSFKF